MVKYEGQESIGMEEQYWSVLWLHKEINVILKLSFISTVLIREEVERLNTEEG